MERLKRLNPETFQFSLFRPLWSPVGFDELKLAGEERVVFAIIKFHIGEARAIKVGILAAHAGRAERTVREALKTLTETYGLAIASSIKPPFGVYLVETAEELRDYMQQLTDRALSMLYRRSVLEKRSLPDLLGQLSLEVR